MNEDNGPCDAAANEPATTPVVPNPTAFTATVAMAGAATAPTVAAVAPATTAAPVTCLSEMLSFFSMMICGGGGTKGG